jgi:hypothetical protein
MVDGPGELNRRVRSRFDDVEDEMDRQNDLDKKRSKAAPRTKSCFLHPFEHQPKRCMEIPPPLKLMELNLLRKPIRQKTRPRKDDRMTRRERRNSKKRRQLCIIEKKHMMLTLGLRGLSNRVDGGLK